jgi:fido (protein-threonine AMPylation protein)
MSDKILNDRQKYILSILEREKDYALSELSELISEFKPSSATLRRDLAALRDLDYLEHTGQLKSSRYQLSPWGYLSAPINPHDYCSVDVDKRNGSKHYNFGLFQGIKESLFEEETLKKMQAKTEFFQEKSKMASDRIKQKELERFVIELSWKSSKIEGNTYSLLDTERLLKDGIEAKGHKKEEATMIINHKKAFQFVLNESKSMMPLTVPTIEEVHKILVEGLGVSCSLRERIVGVTGSKYRPLSVPTQIKEALEDLCAAISRLNDPYSKALIALLGISYIQPFEDGNKRTARLFANAILLSHHCAPLSYRSVDEIHYKESTLVFYEKNSIISMRDIFIEQYLFSCEQYLEF